jgi:hypothetical protein
MIDDFDENDEDLENFEIEELDVEKIKSNFSNYSSERLCEIIVTDRYIGLNKELALACMEELSQRRTNGDSFDFESFIEKEYNSLPKLDFSIPNLQTTLSQVLGSIKR